MPYLVDTDWAIQALRGQRERFIDNLAVQTKAVFIIADTFFQTRRLAVGNHENLLVARFFTAQNVHGKL